MSLNENERGSCAKCFIWFELCSIIKMKMDHDEKDYQS